MSNFGGALNSSANIYDFDSFGSSFQWADPYDGALRSDVFPLDVFPSEPMFSGGRLPGDCYCEDDDVPRGLCMAPSTSRAGEKTIRFSISETPPDVPTNPDFKLDNNTFVPHQWGSASDIINRLLDFFEMEVVGSVTKVSRAKFAAKVDVFDKGMMCSLKFRLYQQEDGQFVVEFQRRSGDSVAFHNVYKQAFLIFEPLLTCTETLVDDATLAEDRPGFSTAAEFTPLVDMLQMGHATELKAQAVACLANIAGNDFAAAAAMCSGNMFEHLKALLDFDSTNVAYPTACLLSSVLKCKEAQPLLSQFGLIPAIEAQIQAPQKCSLVKQQLMDGLLPI